VDTTILFLDEVKEIWKFSDCWVPPKQLLLKCKVRANQAREIKKDYTHTFEIQPSNSQTPTSSQKYSPGVVLIQPKPETTEKELNLTPTPQPKIR